MFLLTVAVIVSALCVFGPMCLLFYLSSSYYAHFWSRTKSDTVRWLALGVGTAGLCGLCYSSSFFQSFGTTSGAAQAQKQYEGTLFTNKHLQPGVVYQVDPQSTRARLTHDEQYVVYLIANNEPQGWFTLSFDPPPCFGILPKLHGTDTIDDFTGMTDLPFAVLPIPLELAEEVLGAEPLAASNAVVFTSSPELLHQIPIDEEPLAEPEPPAPETP